MQEQTKPNSPAVDRLRCLLDLVDRQGLPSLTDDELLELGRLYRRTSSALSRARSLGLESRETEQLNRLVARAYAQVYVGEPRRPGSVMMFFLREFPRTVQSHARFFFAAIGLFLLGGVLGAGLTLADPHMPDVIFGPGWADELQTVADRYVGIKNWLPEQVRPMASTMIMTNNLKVSFLAFATGLFYGLGTMYLLVFNGVLIGATAAVVHQHGVDVGFWAFVAPHGVIELTAIFLSAAGGLILGHALVFPGKYSRMDSLKLAGREAVKLVLGVAAMLFVAGLLEAYFSPAPQIPALVKLQFAAIVGMAEYLYLFFMGRSGKPAREQSAPFATPQGQTSASSLSAR